MIYAGGGVVHAGAAAVLAELARLANAPVVTTLMALGAFPASDRRWLGMLGMHGMRPANWAVDECDLLLAVGARFDDRVTGRVDRFAAGARVVHLDIDPAEIGKIRTPEIALIGDARASLQALVAQLRPLRPDPARLAPWWRVLDAWRAAEPPPAEPGGGAIGVAQALDALQRETGGEAIVTTDVGNHQMWAAKRLRFDAPRRWITSGGLGTMGFGLPAAIGARAAAPDRPVVCVSGDGSLLMNVQELVTAVAEDLPVKVLLINDGRLGMVRQQQDLFWDGRREAVELGPWPDWPGLARSCGWTAERIDDRDDLDDAVRRPPRRARPGAARRGRRRRQRLPADGPTGRRGARHDRLSLYLRERPRHAARPRRRASVSRPLEVGEADPVSARRHPWARGRPDRRRAVSRRLPSRPPVDVGGTGRRRPRRGRRPPRR